MGFIRIALGFFVAGAICPLGSSCSDGDSEITLLDVDVFVESSYIAMYFTEPDRKCDCAVNSWPQIGECRSVPDVITCGCDPPPGACLDSVRLEMDGNVITEKPASDDGGISFLIAGISQNRDYRLVLEGCGGKTSLALPSTDFPSPVITELTNTEDALTIHWRSSREGTGSMGYVGNLHGHKCHDGFGGTTDVIGLRGLEAAQMHVSLKTFDGGAELAEELGNFRIWRGAFTFLDAYIPARADDGRWELPYVMDPSIGFELALNIDGEDPPILPLSQPVVIDLSSGTQLHEFQCLYIPASQGGELQPFRYLAGETMDYMEIGFDPVFSAEFPHVIPARELALGQIEPAGFQLNVGPVVLRQVDDPSSTKEVSFSISYELPHPMSRPIE